jgi:hypothetical protein
MNTHIEVPRRIYFSMPADLEETPQENALKWAVVDAVEARGFIPEISTDPRGRSPLSAGRSWSHAYCNDVIPRCVGAVIIGVPKIILKVEDREYRFATEYCHYEGALAYSLGLPLLVLAEREIEHRVMFGWQSGSEIASFSKNADASWLQTSEFTSRFNPWLEKLSRRCDIFLGYCSSSAGTAINIRDFLEGIGVTVLDWQRDFVAGKSILSEIITAADRCSAGIFLFTKDDSFEGTADMAAPRDNVVFEAGYFTRSKGKDRVLIIRETGAKMPADLGGDIYASLPDKNDTSTIKETLLNFIMNRL